MATSAPTRILGIDPGTLRTGWGVLTIARNQRLGCAAYGVIKLPAKLALQQRLVLLWDELRQVIATHKPTAVGVESLFHQKNAQSALKLGHARGVVLLAIAEAGCPLEEITPAQVKQAATGYGRATKDQIQRMLTGLLGLDETPPEDAADALAVAMALAHHTTR